MNAKQLVSLCTAHGIDFIRVAGGTTNLEGIAGKRRRAWVEIEPGITEEKRSRKSIEAPDTAKGKSSRVARASEWSLAELGIAAYGVCELEWRAAQHTIANDRTPTTLHILHRGLMGFAQKFANQHNWEIMLPACIQRDLKTGRRLANAPRSTTFYREALCMLVLDEISFRPAFAAVPELHALYIGVEPDTWADRLLERYQMLQGQYQGWYGRGLRMIQEGITGDRDDQRPAA